MLTVDPLTGNRACSQAAPWGPARRSHCLTDLFNRAHTCSWQMSRRIKSWESTCSLPTARSSPGRASARAPSISNPNDLELDHAGSLLVSLSSGSILRVDPTTGDRTVVTSSTVGTGPIPSDYFQLGLTASGAIIAANNSANQLLTIDPISGNRTILSDATHGTGPNLLDPIAVAVVPSVPEPSTIVLAALGSLAWLTYRRRLRPTRAQRRPSGTPARSRGNS